MVWDLVGLGWVRCIWWLGIVLVTGWLLWNFVAYGIVLFSLVDGVSETH